MSVEGNAAPSRFTVGGVIAATFSVLFRNVIRFVAIILIVAVPVIACFVGGGMLLSGDMTTNGGRINFEFNGPDSLGIPFILCVALLAGLGYLLILSALIHGTLESLAGRPVSIIGCLSAGLSALPRTFLAAFLLVVTGLLIGLMAMLFVSLLFSIFGAAALVSVASSLLVLMVFARILLFIPALMAERAGVLECFGRSQELTREHRWGLFGILLLMTMVNWIIPFASAFLSAFSPEASNALDIAFAVFFIAFLAVLIGVAFHVLRTSKEGAPVVEIAKVFD
jgi:hypothetical protein